jgi:hypothetical protein
VTRVASLILLADIGDQRLRTLHLNFEGGDQRVFRVNDNVFRFPLEFKANCKLQLCALPISPENSTIQLGRCDYAPLTLSPPWFQNWTAGPEIPRASHRGIRQTAKPTTYDYAAALISSGQAKFCATMVVVAVAADVVAVESICGGHGGANGRFARMAAASRKHAQAAARCDDGIDHQQHSEAERLLHVVDRRMLDLIEDMGGTVIRSGLWT